MPPGVKRKIVLVAGWYPSQADPVGGIFVEEQAVALSARHRVAVIAPRMRRWREGAFRAGPITHEVRRGIDVVRVDAHPILPKWRGATYAGYRTAVHRAYRALERQWGTPDLVHAHVIRYAGWAALSLGRALGVPIVLTEHTGPFSVHVASAFDRAAVERSLAEFDAVIAVSPHLREQMRAVRRVDIDVIGNVVDTDFFQPGSARSGNDVFEVVTASLLTRPKRVDVVLRAVADVRRQTERPVRLTIIGDGPEREHLEELAVNLSLDTAVTFVGTAGREDVRAAMRRASVFVLASESETFGLVAAEAMACQTPVIVTLNGGSQFVVGPDLGVHIRVGSADALADAIGSVMRGSIEIDLERARESIVARFSPSAVVDRLDEVYRRVLRS
jgi:glycosyltransferase involved in cell wall biosynthesis